MQHLSRSAVLMDDQFCISREGLKKKEERGWERFQWQEHFFQHWAARDQIIHSLVGLFLPQILHERRASLWENVWDAICSWGEGVWNLQPFSENLYCKYLVSPAEQGVEAVCSCPSSANSVAMCAPSPESLMEVIWNPIKFFSKRSSHYFSSGENFKPYKFLKKFEKYFCETGLRQLHWFIPVMEYILEFLHYK